MLSKTCSIALNNVKTADMAVHALVLQGMYTELSEKLYLQRGSLRNQDFDGLKSDFDDLRKAV